MTKKEKLLTFTALAVLLTSGFPALAQDADDTPPLPMGDERPMMGFNKDRGPQGDRPYGDPDKMAERQAEMQKRGAERFAKIDKNGDGYLTKDEMLEAHKGKLDEMFANADTNKDGKLSPDELRTSKKKMMEKFRDKMKDNRGNCQNQGSGQGKGQGQGQRNNN